MREMTAGLDLASQEHRLVVVDAGGGRLEQRRIGHTADGIDALVRRLGELRVVRVAIEQPNGLVCDRITAAELLAEIGDNRARHPTSASLRAIAGQAPVTIQSGKKQVARFRWACNKNLRAAINVLADTSRHHNPRAADIYQHARSRGHDHPHAIRNLGRAWTRVIWRMWQDGTTHNPTRHRNLNQTLTTGG
jgi:transposase